MTLRLAIQEGFDHIFEYLWNTYGDLYHESILQSVTRHMVVEERYESIMKLLESETTKKIIANASLSFR